MEMAQLSNERVDFFRKVNLEMYFISVCDLINSQYKKQVSFAAYFRIAFSIRFIE